MNYSKSNAALGMARRYARKAEGGAELEPPQEQSPTEGLKRVYVTGSEGDNGDNNEAKPPRPEGFGLSAPYEEPRRGPLDRALAGIRHAYGQGGEFGISGENLRKYPGLLPLQPIAAGADAAMRTISAGIHGISGLAGGVAGDFGGQAQGDRMERDMNVMGQVAMPELASPLGLHSVPRGLAKAGETLDKMHDPNSLSMAPAIAPKPKPKEFFHPYDLDPAEVKGAVQAGPQKGSNPGGLYHLANGEPVYIKTPPTIEHTYNEKLAAELYKAAGVPVADVKMSKFSGSPSIVSPIIPGKVLKSLDYNEWGGVKGIKENYPVDLWLGNYDFVGTGKDNLIVDHAGNAWRIDTGGALRFRAQGELKNSKMWSPNVEHFDLNKSPDIADLVPNLNDPSMKPAAQRVANMTDEQIAELVGKFGPLQKGEKPVLIDTLIKRRDAIAKMYGVKKGGSSEPTGGSGGNLSHAEMDKLLAEIEKSLEMEPSLAPPPKHKAPDFDPNFGLEPYQPNFLEKASDKLDDFLQPAADKIEDMIKAANQKMFGKKEAKVVPIKEEPKKLYTHIEAKSDPALLKPKADQLAEMLGNDPKKIAEELVEIAQKHGAEYADQLGSKMPESIRHEVGHNLDQMDYEAQQAKHHSGPAPDDWMEPHSYAYDDDVAPKGWDSTGPVTDDAWHHGKTYGGKPVLNYSPEKVKEWSQMEPLPPTIRAKPVEFFQDLIKKADTPESPVREIKDFANWTPPVQYNLVAPKPTKKSLEETGRLGFNKVFSFLKGGYEEYKYKYPDYIKDNPKLNWSFGEAEPAFFGADVVPTANGYGPVGKPYMVRAPRAIEVYWPHLTGELWEAKHNPSYSIETDAARVKEYGATYTGNTGILQKLIKAGHEENIDLIAIHGMDDNGAYNHTQYLLLNTRGTLRGFDADFDPKKLHPAHPESHGVLKGVVGGTPFVYGILKNEQEDKDKKMARGGRTKFKPHSTLQIKERRLPRTVIHTGKAAKALRTAKKLATGGKADDPQEHHFINFKKGGMIDSDIPGRTDEIPMKVASGAYVLPADIPSALGQGNTMAGKSILDGMFGGDDSPQMAAGGPVDDDHVPIVAAGGEYLIHPNKVKEIGQGDMSKGHRVLDQFVLHTRKEHIKTLKGLKPPK